MKLAGTYLLGGVLAVPLVLVFLAYSEHAVVKVTVQPEQIRVESVLLAGGAQSAGLATRELVASVSEQQAVTSGMVQVPASPAGGRVTFMCSPMSSCPNGYTVAAGTIIESTSGFKYRTLSTASFPSCAPSSPVNVSALIGGAAGNAGAGTVVYGQFPGYIHVNNPSPIVGGVDAYNVHVVQQSDVDQASQTLSAKVSSELDAKLIVEAGDLSYVTTGLPAFTTTSDAPVGANAPTFTVTVSGTLHAIAYSARDAKALLGRVLSQKVPTGYRLISDTVAASYSVQTTGEITGSATGYMVPNVNAKALATAVRGLSVGEARNKIDRSVPSGATDIEITPLALPWLPFVSDHISVAVVNRGAA